MKADTKKRADHRAKIIEGQIKTLVASIEEDKYCVDIITQSLAVQKSLKSLNKLVLENHLQTHVKEGLSEGSEKEKDVLIEELVSLYELYSIRQ